jgi:hypothetical protein
MEDIYEKMNRWAEEKKAIDEHFWAVSYPTMNWENKMIWWRKDIFNAMQKFGAENIPQEWIAERKAKEPLFEVLMEEVMKKLS